MHFPYTLLVTPLIFLLGLTESASAPISPKIPPAVNAFVYDHGHPDLHARCKLGKEEILANFRGAISAWGISTDAKYMTKPYLTLEVTAFETPSVLYGGIGCSGWIKLELSYISLFHKHPWGAETLSNIVVCNEYSDRMFLAAPTDFLEATSKAVTALVNKCMLKISK